MFAAFDLIRVINLPHRRDRRAQMERELARAGLAGDPRVAFFDAIRPADQGRFSSIGAHGVYMSHRAILREAASRSSSVLILEDDCDFAEGIEEKVVGADWDILYGGYTAADPTDLARSDIIGAHMMGFSATGAKRVLDFLDAIETDEIHPPIDGAYVWFRRANPAVAVLFAEPPLGFQRPSRSDIEPGALYNRLPLIRGVVEIARRARRAFTGKKRTDLRKLQW